MSDELKQAMAGAALCIFMNNMGECFAPSDHDEDSPDNCSDGTCWCGKRIDEFYKTTLDAIEAQGWLVVQWPPTQEQFERAYHDTNWPKPTALPRKQTLREFCKAMVQAGRVKEGEKDADE